MAKITKPRSTKGLAALCAKIADDKIAKDIVIMDLTHLESSPSDFFVICSCDTDHQIEAIANQIDFTMNQIDFKSPRVEGLEGKEWVLLDFFDVVVHVMLTQAREFYKLEKLWGDAVFYKLDSEGKPKKLTNSDTIKYFKETV